MAKEIAHKTSTPLTPTRRKELANAITSMTYGELMEIGNELAELVQRRKRLEPKEEFAALFAAMLHYWASQDQ